MRLPSCGGLLIAPPIEPRCLADAGGRTRSSSVFSADAEALGRPNRMVDSHIVQLDHTSLRTHGARRYLGNAGHNLPALEPRRGAGPGRCAAAAPATARQSCLPPSAAEPLPTRLVGRTYRIRPTVARAAARAA